MRSKRESKNRDWRQIVFQEVYDRTGGLCAYCKRQLLFMSEMTIDHVIPVSKGGANTLSNMVLSCEECNLKKGDTIIESEQSKH